MEWGEAKSLSVAVKAQRLCYADRKAIQDPDRFTAVVDTKRRLETTQIHLEAWACSEFNIPDRLPTLEAQSE